MNLASQIGYNGVVFLRVGSVDSLMKAHLEIDTWGFLKLHVLVSREK